MTLSISRPIRRAVSVFVFSVGLPAYVHALSPVSGDLTRTPDSVLRLNAPAVAPVYRVVTPANPEDSAAIAPDVLGDAVIVGSAYAGQQPGLDWGMDVDFEDLLSALEGLAEHGLVPEHYNLSYLKSLRDHRVARDAVATHAWLQAASDLLTGRLDPVALDRRWSAPGRTPRDLEADLKSALAEGSVRESLAALAPQREVYQRMVLALRDLLKRDVENDVPAEEASTAELDRRDTMATLRVNLERERWLADDLGERHVRVNIPQFQLQAFENGKAVRTHRTVVGKRWRRTPVFSSEIKYVVINPWWNIPRRIARVDKLRLFKRDPDSFKRLGYQALDRDGEVVDPDTIDWKNTSRRKFPYRLRQAPGDKNALGRVKIMFPNRYNVYVHDTPTKKLFKRDVRAYSSGCIRTENPFDLAEWVLESERKWSRKAIDKTLSRGRVRRVNLKKFVPVHILYHTAVADDAGGVKYLEDIYRRDLPVLSQLNAAPAGLSPDDL